MANEQSKSIVAFFDGIQGTTTGLPFQIGSSFLHQSIRREKYICVFVIKLEEG